MQRKLPGLQCEYGFSTAGDLAVWRGRWRQNGNLAIIKVILDLTETAMRNNVLVLSIFSIFCASATFCCGSAVDIETDGGGLGVAHYIIVW